jgi:hypothetical protein
LWPNRSGSLVVPLPLVVRGVLQVLMLVMIVGQLSGVAQSTSADVCGEDCPDDAQGKTCPPFCPSCTCAARPAPIAPSLHTELAPVLPTPRLVELPERDRTPAMPDPGEILHVPKSLLA